jgi:hypothetical protein
LDDPFSVSTIDISKKLLDRTGKGTRSLLYDSLKENKYGPTIEGQDQPISEPKKSKDSNQPPQKTGYLSFGEFQRVKDEQAQSISQQEVIDALSSSNTVTDKLGTRPISTPEFRTNLNSSARNQTSNLTATDGLTVLGENQQTGARPNTPTESENPELREDTNEKLKKQGFEFQINGQEYDPSLDNFKGGWDWGHNTAWNQQWTGPEQAKTYNPERSVGYDTNSGAEPGPQYRGGLYWKDGRSDSSLPRRGLLRYTQKLINKSTNVNGAAAKYIGMPNSDQNYDANGDVRKHTTMSQGNLVKTADGKYYCRSWSVRNTYNTYEDLIRNDALWRENQPGGKKLSDYVTLREPGLPKIAWERDDISEKAIVAALKNNSGYVPKEYVIPYMLSIENLAWKGSPHYFKLPACERGPNGGRIMWFPPYNINFTDNTSINWDSTVFIGRAEPIYTYNHTERTGTLTFSVIVDHPSILNKLREDFSANLETFFAGCDTEKAKGILQEAFQGYTTPNTEQNNQDEDPIPQTNWEDLLPTISENDTLKFYFKNAVRSTIKDDNVTRGGSASSSCPDGIIGRCIDENYERSPVSSVDNAYLYKLNGINTDDPDIDPTGSELIPYPSGQEPPCPGNSEWGPETWPKSSAGNVYKKGLNFCRKTTPTPISLNGVVGTTATHGFKYDRDGINDRDFFEKAFDTSKIGEYGVGIDGLINFLVKDPLGKAFTINIKGGTSDAASTTYNTPLAQDRAKSLYDYMYKKMVEIEGGDPVFWPEEGVDPIQLYSESRYQLSTGPLNEGVPGGVAKGFPSDNNNGRWNLSVGDVTSSIDVDENWSDNEFTQTPARLHPQDREYLVNVERRTSEVTLTPNIDLIRSIIEDNKRQQIEELRREEDKKKKAEQEALRQNILNTAKNFINECDYFTKIKKDQPFIYESIRDKIQNFHPAFHSMTPEGFNSRLNFLQQCGRQGPSFIDPLQPQNTAFGKPPICILRIGDFYHTKIVIDTINFTFDPIQWDLNPEGIGVQPMVCSVDLNFKFIGGSTLQGPLRQLQNAVSYNFFANTSLYMGLEEIIAKRGEGSGFLVAGEGENDTQTKLFNESDKETEVFWYGPFGSQDTADRASLASQGEIGVEDIFSDDDIETLKVAEQARQAAIEEEKRKAIEEAEKQKKFEEIASNITFKRCYDDYNGECIDLEDGSGLPLFASISTRWSFIKVVSGEDLEGFCFNYSVENGVAGDSQGGQLAGCCDVQGPCSENYIVDLSVRAKDDERKFSIWYGDYESDNPYIEIDENLKTYVKIETIWGNAADEDGIKKGPTLTLSFNCDNPEKCKPNSRLYFNDIK